jgi:hypothetical protein
MSKHWYVRYFDANMLRNGVSSDGYTEMDGRLSVISMKYEAEKRAPLYTRYAQFRKSEAWPWGLDGNETVKDTDSLWECNLIRCLMKESDIPSGYKMYTVRNSLYGYIITPAGHILYVQEELDGLSWQFLYVPSRMTGSGCACTDEGKSYRNADPLVINLEMVTRKEAEGLSFSRELHAELYGSPFNWMKNLWNVSSLDEIQSFTGNENLLMQENKGERDV